MGSSDKSNPEFRKMEANGSNKSSDANTQTFQNSVNGASYTSSAILKNRFAHILFQMSKVSIHFCITSRMDLVPLNFCWINKSKPRATIAPLK